MYADNHQICASHQLIENVATLLNNKAKIVSDWHKNNFLLANRQIPGNVSSVKSKECTRGAALGIKKGKGHNGECFC